MACRVHPTKIGPMLDTASVDRVRGEAFALISQGYSKLSLQERLGLTKGSARGYIDRFRLKAKAEAVPLPPCRCGGPHNHLGHCENLRRPRWPQPLGKPLAEMISGTTRPPASFRDKRPRGLCQCTHLP